MDFQNLDNATREYLLRLILNNQLRELQSQQQRGHVNAVEDPLQVSPPRGLLSSVLTLEDMQRALSGAPQVVSTSSLHNQQTGISPSSPQQILQGNVVVQGKVVAPASASAPPPPQTERILSGVLPGSSNIAAFAGQGEGLEQSAAHTKQAALENYLLQAQAHARTQLTLLEPDHSRKVSENERYLLLAQILGAPQAATAAMGDGVGVKLSDAVTPDALQKPDIGFTSSEEPVEKKQPAVQHQSTEPPPVLGTSQPTVSSSSKYNHLDLQQIDKMLHPTGQEGGISGTKNQREIKGKRSLPHHHHRQRKVVSVSQKASLVSERGDHKHAEGQDTEENMSVRRSSRKQKEVKRYGALGDDQAYFCGRATLKYKGEAERKAMKQDKGTLEEKELFLSFMGAAGIDKDAAYLRGKGGNTNATEYVAFEISLGDLCFLSCLVSNGKFHKSESLLDACKNLFDWFDDSTHAGVSQLQSFSGFSSSISLSDSARELLTRTPKKHASERLAEHLQRDERFRHIFDLVDQDGSRKVKGGAYYYLSGESVSLHRYFIKKNDLGKERSERTTAPKSVNARKGQLLSSIATQKWKQAKAKVSPTTFEFKIPARPKKKAAAVPTTKGSKRKEREVVVEKEKATRQVQKHKVPRRAPAEPLPAPPPSIRSSRDAVDCRSRASPIGGIDLTSIINSDTFYDILSPEDRSTLMKWLPEIDADLLISCEKGKDKKGSNSFFANCQVLSWMEHYQDLLRDGLLEECSSRVWIPSKLARAERTSAVDKPKFYIPQLGEVIYGENIPNKVLGIN